MNIFDTTKQILLLIATYAGVTAIVMGICWLAGKIK